MLVVIHCLEKKGAGMARFDLTDSEWSVIQPLLPRKSRGVKRVDDRRVLNGIFWRLRTGAPWADIPSRYGPSRYGPSRYGPSRYGPHTTLCQPVQPLAQGGCLGDADGSGFKAYDGKVQMIDASSVRVHQHAANGQKS